MAGSAIADNGAILYWLRGNAFVLRLREGSTDTLCRKGVRHVVAAGFTVGDSVVEIVDSDPTGRAVRILRATAPHCRVRARAGLAARVVAAARSGTGWVLATEDESQVQGYVGIDAGGSELWTVAGDSGRAAATNPSMASMTGSTSGIVCSSMAWPFKTSLITNSGEVTPLLQPDSALLAEADTGWIGLAAIPILHGFVQTLADPRSDRRVIILFDSNGHILSLSRVETALGLVAAAPSGRVLIALRRTDYDELVTYEVLGDVGDKRR